MLSTSPAFFMVRRAYRANLVAHRTCPITAQFWPEKQDFLDSKPFSDRPRNGLSTAHESPVRIQGPNELKRGYRAVDGLQRYAEVYGSARIAASPIVSVGNGPWVGRRGRRKRFCIRVGPIVSPPDSARCGLLERGGEHRARGRQAIATFRDAAKVLCERHGCSRRLWRHELG